MLIKRLKNLKNFSYDRYKKYLIYTDQYNMKIQLRLMLHRPVRTDIKKV